MHDLWYRKTFSFLFMKNNFYVIQETFTAVVFVTSFGNLYFHKKNIHRTDCRKNAPR